MNQTIYFRKDVWEKLQDEKFKSNLINQLLSVHYGLDPKEWAVSDEPLAEKFISKPMLNIPGVVRGVHYCRAGHLSDENGRCMQKGCKYS